MRGELTGIAGPQTARSEEARGEACGRDLEAEAGDRVGRGSPVERDAAEAREREARGQESQRHQSRTPERRAQRARQRERAERGLEPAVHGAQLGAPGRRLERDPRRAGQEARIEEAPEAVGKPEQRRESQEDAHRHARPPSRGSAFPGSSRVKITKAMLGRFEDSRIANWMVSSVQPLPVHSFRIVSSSSSLTRAGLDHLVIAAARGVRSGAEARGDSTSPHR